MSAHRFPVLTPCGRAGCRRLTHRRYCPEHVDDEQRDLEQLLDEVLLERDLLRDRDQELTEMIEVLDRRLGVRRP